MFKIMFQLEFSIYMRPFLLISALYTMPICEHKTVPFWVKNLWIRPKPGVVVNLVHWNRNYRPTRKPDAVVLIIVFAFPCDEPVHEKKPFTSILKRPKRFGANAKQQNAHAFIRPADVNIGNRRSSSLGYA